MSGKDIQNPAYDVVVVGGGAAGLMAAATAAARGLSVAVLERERRCGKKLLITGKGRCNVVNDCDAEQFQQKIRQGGRFLRSALADFGPAEIRGFFESRGVPLKVERGNRVFPCSDRAADIADALIAAAGQAGCAFLAGRAAAFLFGADGAVCGLKLEDGQAVSCRAAIVATGGLSYPGTGSTGDGYVLARSLGHTVTPLRPSLVPLVCAGDSCPAMQGLSLKNVELRAVRGKKILYRDQGELLFTHFGISGPLALSLSAALVGADWNEVRVTLDMKPALDEPTLDRRILRDFAENLNREFKNSLGALLPQKMIPEIVRLTQIPPEKKVHSLTAAERAALVAAVKRFPLAVTGPRPIAEAVVTAGGVELREIDPRTMQSKRIPNVSFAGEVLDADGYTGGFNLGIAFATGHAAGKHVLEEKGDFA